MHSEACRFHLYSVGLSLAAAITSAATFVINPGLIANYGISGVLSYAVFSHWPP